MADFRKWFMVIAVVLLTAASAFGQAQIVTIPCTTSAQVPIIRAGAITDYIGEVDLSCDATQVTSVPTVTVQFALATDTTVTNSTDNTGVNTMAGLAVEYQRAPQAIYDTVQGIVYSTYANANNGYRFPHVVLPMATTFIVRIFNVRVASLALSGSYAGTQLFGIVTANTENPSGYTVGFTNQPAEGLLVAVVQPTMSFAVTDCTGTKAQTANISFQQCVDYTLSGFSGFGNLTQSATAQAYGVTFTELQQTAFKNVVEEDGATIPQVNNPAVGPQICDTTTSSPYIQVSPPIPACTTGPWVSNGTRLLAQWLIPTALVGKVHIYVTKWQTAGTNGTAAQLAAFSNPAANVGWGNDGSSSSGSYSCAGASGGHAGNYWVELPDAATETAAWEIQSDSLANLDQITFAWVITYAEDNLPSLGVGGTYGPIVLQGTMAPITTQAVPAPVTLATEPVVRFNLPFQPASAQVTIDHCVTNLLWPYVTNFAFTGGAFETGIAIANTSLDDVNYYANPTATPVPFGTTPQSGPCNLYLFGSTSAQNTAGAGTAGEAFTSVTSKVTIAAGTVFADTLSNIFALNKGSSPTIVSGYVIAVCDFQFAHGYAYIINGANGNTQGYLALVIPDRSLDSIDPNTGNLLYIPIRIAQPFSTAIFDEQGEILAP